MWLAKIIIKIFKLESWVLTNAVRELYNTIGTEDILRYDNGYWYGGRTLTEPEIKYFQDEAKRLVDSKFWKMLKSDIQYQANKTMFEKAKSEHDLTAGKLWLYTLNCIEEKLNELSNSRQ